MTTLLSPPPPTQSQQQQQQQQPVRFVPENLPSMKILHMYNQNHLLFMVQVKDILDITIDNWEYNRPPDMVRCKEIAKYIYDRKPELDWMLYMIIDNNNIKIIDGIHRFCALQILKTENQKSPDFLSSPTPNEFGCAGDAQWFYNRWITISMRINPSRGETIDLFENINKSIPVPELYIENTSAIKKSVIEETVINWIKKYPSHFKSNASIMVPHMNRDLFIGILDKIYDHFCINNQKKHLLEQLLVEMNGKVMMNIPKKTPERALTKCKQSGCYLFLIRHNQLVDYICDNSSAAYILT